MGVKQGDWKSIDGIYHYTVEMARLARDGFSNLNPEARLRIKAYSTLGYSVQVFVERTVRA